MFSDSPDLFSWLASDLWTADDLRQWLQGERVPNFARDCEPYIWILYGLSTIEDRRQISRELARKTAEILWTQPDIDRTGWRHSQLLFNLLMLCAHLSFPDQLGRPLQSILNRRALAAKWLGKDLRDCLRRALIRNQFGRDLEPHWMAMVTNRGHSFLNGTEFSTASRGSG